MTAKPFAFVLMPFDEAFNDIYKLGIQATANEQGIVAERVDEQSFSETILERIYRQIRDADFIVADMTGRNPNVFYEVGYAHALGKPCTLVTQSVSDIPFDLKHHRHIVYDASIQKLKAALTREFEWLLSEHEKRNTRSLSVELKSAYGDLVKTDYSAEAVIEFTFDIHNRTDQRSPDIEAMYLYTAKGWRLEQGGENCPNTQAANDSPRLRHFVKPPITKLSKGAWAQVNVTARKGVWSKWEGKELKEKYTFRGKVYLEICTSEGNFTEQFPVEVTAEEFPF